MKKHAVTFAYSASRRFSSPQYLPTAIDENRRHALPCWKTSGTVCARKATLRPPPRAAARSMSSNATIVFPAPVGRTTSAFRPTHDSASSRWYGRSTRPSYAGAARRASAS